MVVFENGLGARLDWWSKGLARHRGRNPRWHTTARATAAAMRPQPRDGAQVVQELRALLQGRQLPPPMCWSATRWAACTCSCMRANTPAGVAALVLVDSTHPEQMRGAGNPTCGRPG